VLAKEELKQSIEELENRIDRQEFEEARVHAHDIKRIDYKNYLKDKKVGKYSP
jgi:hypothetical protein